jgi:hypothetical protein
MIRRSLFVLLTALAFTSPPASADWPGWKSLVGSGVARSESREVGAFTGIVLSIPAVVEIKMGDKESIVVEADDNLVALVETVVEEGKLRIRFKDRFNLSHSRDIKVFVVARRIESLAISGSGDIRAAALKCDKLDANISGSGDIRIGKLECGAVRVAISGSGDCSVGGKADSLEASIAGSGDVVAGTLETRRAAVNIAGSGDAQVWAREALSISVVGSGDVAYFGDPAISKSVLGSGSVKRLGPRPG